MSVIIPGDVDSAFCGIESLILNRDKLIIRRGRIQIGSENIPGINRRRAGKGIYQCNEPSKKNLQ
jgi:hypothetical protein